MIKSIKSFIHMISLDRDETEIYCREKRYERYEKYGGRIRFLWLHTVAHGILIPVLKIQDKLCGHKLIVLHDRRKKTNRPLIFCPTHIGGADIEMAFEAIKTSCWLALGDPRELYKDISGMMLQMNGVIPLDTLHKKDRKVGKAQMEALLKKGGNLLIFPEGAYNISPNLLLNHLFAGAVELAITCHAEIVPIAIEREGKTYYVNIGENLDYSAYSVQDKFALTDALRDHMATLKWEMIEQLPPLKRNEIPEDYFDRLLDEILTTDVADYTYTVEDIIKTQFHPKDQTDPEEVFAFLDKLHPCRENAFLLRKRT